MAKEIKSQLVFRSFSTEDVHAILARYVADERGVPVDKIAKTHVAWCYPEGERNFSQARVEIELL